MTELTPESSRPALLRLADANLNRTAEALRVLEDCLRFVLTDPLLTRRCKAIRHDIAAWARRFPGRHRIAMRDARGDVGRSTAVESEYARSGVEDLLRANFSRAGQSLRVLEEFAKTIDAESAQTMETLRYQIYDLEKAVLTLVDSLQRLQHTRLYALVDSGGNLADFRRRVEQLVAAGVDAIQFRDKTLDDRQLTEFARHLVAATRTRQVLSIINDRADIAVATGADGVHVGQDDLAVADVRRIAGPDLLVGVSTHNLGQARQAVAAGANYLGVGPTFPSSTKPFREFTGPDLLRQVFAEISLPAFAIGGITLDNLDAVLESGIRRIAISGAISGDLSTLPRLVDQLKSKLEATRVPR